MMILIVNGKAHKYSGKATTKALLQSMRIDCERVAVMRDGKLLAMDTPTNLKKSIITGDVWEVYAHPLEKGLEARCLIKELHPILT